MTEVVEQKGFGTRRLVLGFDAGCMTCSELARKIEEEVGEKLEVRPLHDPQVIHWRERALGEEAPWAPTLVEVNGGDVRAWTGLKMGVVLSRRLGPGTTWRVMQLIGELKAAPSSTPSIGLSRGQFIKGLGGAAVGFGVLSASGGLASPALAAEDELNEEGLIEAFSLIEQIPDSVMEQGDEAAREWLRDKLQAESQSGTFQTQGAFACARSITQAIIFNIVPVGKVRAAIRAFGGAVKLARFIIRRYRRARRRFGYGPITAARKVARLVANRTFRTTGEQVFDAILTLFDLNGVRRNCF